MSSSPIRRARAEAGATLVELSLGLVLLAIASGVSVSAALDSTRSELGLTVEAEMRAKGLAALEMIERDLRSTQTAAGAVALAESNRRLTFYPVTSVRTTGTPGPVFATAATVFRWDSAQITGNNSWPASKLTMTRHDAPGKTIGLVGDVSNFTVTPVGVSGTSGFSATAPLTLQIYLELTRKRVGPPSSGNPDGRVVVPLRLNVTVPKG